MGLFAVVKKSRCLNICVTKKTRMKNLTFCMLLMPFIVTAQQNLQTNIQLKFKKGVDATKKSINYDNTVGSAELKLPVFSIFGIANLNQETLKTFNAGGKATVAVRPFIKPVNNKTTASTKAIAFFASFNKSASNNDSIIHPKLIFPELGSSSFLGTLQYEKFILNDVGKIHSSAIFFELGVKSIRTDSAFKAGKLSFDALNYTLGYKYGFCYIKKDAVEEGKNLNLGFYISPFISAFNIPDEDKDDYKKILLYNATVTGNPENLTDFVVNFGVKTGFHFNGIEFFSDLRHVLGKSKVPIRELRGFHANIGFIFNADVLNFY